jgi:small-conductance mechanosensitive channel
MELFWICTLLALLGLAGVVLTFLSGLTSAGVDGLFLALVGLLVAAIFGVQALWLARQFGWLRLRSRSPRRQGAMPEGGTSSRESHVAVGGMQR